MRVDAIEFVPERRTWQAPPGHIDSEATWKMAIEIVDLPIYPIKSGDFPSFFVCLPEGTAKHMACGSDVYNFYAFGPWRIVMLLWLHMVTMENFIEK